MLFFALLVCVGLSPGAQASRVDQALAQVGARIVHLRAQGLEPTAYFDLDDTLFDHASPVESPNPEVVSLILEWSALGARIVFVSGRRLTRLTHTRAAILSAGVPMDGLMLTDDSEEPLPAFKRRSVQRDLLVSPLRRAVAFIDDQASHLLAVGEIDPQINLILARLAPHRQPPSSEFCGAVLRRRRL